MTKVYLLLRENHQSGPYTIDELKQQHLRPTDLVWVEGQSHAWCYPSEIEGLGKAPASSPERSVRSGGAARPAAPMDEIEERAEELRKRAMTFTHSNPRYQQPVIVDEDDRGTVYLPRERELEVVYHKKIRSKPSYSASQLVAAGLITAILAAGWYGRDSLFQYRTKAVSATVTPFVPVQTPRSGPAKAAAVTPEQATMAVVPLTPQQNTTVPARKMMKTVAQSSNSPEDPQLAMAAPVSTEPEVTTPPKEEEKKPEIVKAPASPAPAEAEVKKEPIAEPEKKTEAKEEKKKTLGQAIKGIFKKKKKDSGEE
jgi:hypothetical protein